MESGTREEGKEEEQEEEEKKKGIENKEEEDRMVMGRLDAKLFLQVFGLHEGVAGKGISLEGWLSLS